MFRRTFSSRQHAPRRSAPRTSRNRPARRARLLTRRAKLNAARRPRRGVLLLVVLSLLVLFLMVGMAFVVTAKQSEKAAKSSMKAAVRISGEAAQGDLLDEVLMQIVRDTNNPNSSLRFHSLLGDMYGNDGLKSRVMAGGASWADAVFNPAPDATGGVTVGQMIDLLLDQTYVKNLQDVDVDAYGNYFNMSSPPNPAPARLGPYDNAYSGQVLTFLSGPAKGISTRIVGFVPPNRIRVMNTQLKNGALIDPTVLTQIGAEQSRILINGRPFSGTGFGYNRGAGVDDPKLSLLEEVGGTPFPLALLPNAKFLDVNRVHQTASDTANPDYLLNSAALGYLSTLTGAARTQASINLAAQFGPAGIGGPNEGYDVADFQNMALAYAPATQLTETMLPGALPTTIPLGALGTAATGSLVIPSWHRPDLINYLGLQLASGSADLMQSTLGANPLLLRKAMLRPNWVDHPNFTGSNPELAAIPAGQQAQKLARMVYGPWDVDNDNDGVRDSVWIDVGLPVMAGPNGKLVKPLVAMQIVDMDGRANVNAAGTCDLAKTWSQSDIQDLQTTGAPQPTASLGLSTFNTPQGVGYGPADINLASVVGANDFQTLLVGTNAGTQFVPGKYGYKNASNVVRPGVIGSIDALSQIGMFGWPQKANIRSGFGTPPDLRARYGLGVNFHGQPIFDATQSAEIMNANSDLLVDSPYEINLSQKTAAGVQGYSTTYSAADALFSEVELERMLRTYDADAGTLPGRLAFLSGMLRGVPKDFTARNKLTSISFDLPSPSVSLPHEMRDDAAMYSTNPLYRRPPRTVAELIEMRVRKALGLSPFPVPETPANALKIRSALARLLAPELANGQRLDINRSIGNGFDDAPQNGIVDEPGEETAGAASIWRGMTAAPYNAPFFPGVAKEYVIDSASADPNNPMSTPQQVGHRQLLARHLYALALTTAAEATYDGTQSGDKELAQRIAQWAINVVDFRDPDNIMTPFEYDLNPFDGWDVDGEIGTAGPDGIVGTSDDATVPSSDDSASHRGLVWGAERPELVMTESLAWHNRNTTDEGDEDPNPGELAGSTADALPNKDTDFDQLYRPQGAFFLELYNPWPASVAPSLDLHAADASDNDRGVDLARTHNQAGNGDPVWRVVVSRDVDTVKDPDDSILANRPQIERSIYFTRNDPGFSDDGVAFYNEAETGATGAAVAAVRPVRPGRYMVVGSGLQSQNGVFSSYLGQRLDQTPNGNNRKPLRRIELDTNDDPHAVRMMNAFDTTSSAANNTEGPRQTPPVVAYEMQAPSEQDATAQNALPFVPGNDRLSVADVAIINAPRRLTLSEPANGYPRRLGNVQFAPLPASQNDPSEGGRYCLGGDPNRPKAIDTPLDDGDPELAQLGTDFSKGRRLFLQRLANPLAPYDPTANPYLTIDDTRAYITVFNGRLGSNEQEGSMSNRDALAGFSSAERGYDAAAQPADLSLWKTRADENAQNEQKAESDTKRQGTLSSPNFSMKYLPQATLGFLNRVYMDGATTNVDALRLQPDQPFAWLSWNNRPFVSGNELMLVPRHRSSQMLRYFRSAEKPAANWNQYDPADVDNPRRQFAVSSNFQAKPFSHLENFFSTEPSGAGGTPTTGVPLHLYRLLDYVQTPSLFAGTETWLNPASFSSAATTAPNSLTDPRSAFMAPFNRVSEFRDPGRVNINTVSEKDSAYPDRTVWNGLFHGQTTRKGALDPAETWVHPGPTLEEWVASRRGYGPATLPATALDAAFPSVFSNPERPADAGDLVPIPGMIRSGVDCTLLRSLTGTAGTSARPNGDPLFSTETIGAQNEHRNSQRNGYFRYQPLVRLDNLVTNRSNVYAVWITVGFFEVEDAPSKADFAAANGGISDPQLTELYNRVYPEGYRFAREDGIDVGNVRRLRGFYMIDRTKMAGFEPGADHNVEEVIRLRRRIE